ncbi:unnamed protein product [Urochloa decumbens]|uniref:DUF1618 domain-containing protein n=1 Tax=Urochloa decumbens TaxID=240449 RepID=A0ABC8WCK2_9POAL
MELALRESSSWSEHAGRHKAVRAEMMRYRGEVEEPAFELLRQRKASCAGAGVRKEPVTFSRGDADYLREVLEGMEPCLSATGTCSVLVLCVGNCRPGNRERGFYLVYNTRATSVAVVPPLPRGAASSSSRSHCDIAGGLAGPAVLCLGTAADDDGYLLAELLLRRDGRSHRPTNKAAGTLFFWEAAPLGSQHQLQREVDLPLLPPPVADQDYSFCADTVFPVGSTALCWADLLSGALLYDHSAASTSSSNKQQPCFHFIPLPDGYAAKNPSEIRGQRCPREFRSMCRCVHEDTLKFVSMDQQDDTLTVWALLLHHPLTTSPTDKSRWHKEASFRIRDLCWDDTADIKDDLKLQPPALGFPVISSTLPLPGAGGVVIYLSLTDYEYTSDNHQCEAALEATRLYVLNIDMRRWRVLSDSKVTARRNGTIPHHRLFATRIEFADT